MEVLHGAVDGGDTASNPLSGDAGFVEWDGHDSGADGLSPSFLETFPAEKQAALVLV
jgi:hypothetical protein